MGPGAPRPQALRALRRGSPRHLAVSAAFAFGPGDILLFHVALAHGRPQLPFFRGLPTCTVSCGQRPGRLSVRDVGIRQALGNGGIGAREQGNQLVALRQKWLQHLALGYREARRTSLEFGSEVGVEGAGGFAAGSYSPRRA